jgi:hypothetical protein
LSHREAEPAAQAETPWSDVAFGATKERELRDDVTAVDIKAMAREAQQRDARETHARRGSTTAAAPGCARVVRRSRSTDR